MGPLASLRVLDFTTLLPGPYATMILADLGADVVRVEAPNRPDLMRITPPYDGETSVGHALVGRSKRSVALDLKHPQAAGIVQRLVAHYDVVVEGFRPGVMDRLGVGYEVLKEANPSLIYVSITGYGQTGPYARRAGHDINYLALSGILSTTGRAATGPVVPSVQLADQGGGSLFGVVGLLAAVVHRHTTGEGQHVDVSMLDGALALNAFNASRTLAAGDVPGYETDPLSGGSFYGTYRTQDDRYLAVGSLEPKFWTAFCAAIGRPDLVQAGMDLWDAQVQACVRAAVSEAIAEKPLAAWQAIFADADVCVEPVLTQPEVAEHPQVTARGMVVDVPRDASGGTQRQVAHPVRYSATPPVYKHTGGALGRDTAAVLEAAGCTSDEITAWQAAGLFGDVDIPAASSSD